MKKLLALAALVAVAAGPMSACTIAKISGAGAREIILNNPTGKQFDVIKHFSVDVPYRWDFTNSYEIDKAVADVLEETNADAVINVKANIKITFGDYCLTSVTCGFANAKTLSVEGDAIKYK